MLSPTLVPMFTFFHVISHVSILATTASFRNRTSLGRDRSSPGAAPLFKRPILSIRQPTLLSSNSTIRISPGLHHTCRWSIVLLQLLLRGSCCCIVWPSYVLGILCHLLTVTNTHFDHQHSNQMYGKSSSHVKNYV
jgi:hypothetical protein